jgi:rhomboid protease GluP
MVAKLTALVREAPATLVLSLLWIAVFIAMIATQLLEGRGMTLRELLIGLQVGHRFGDMSVRELFQGQIWRALTSTFVHYGLIHIGLNLIAFYQLGRMIESWYGSGQFLGVYVLTGGGGNLLSAAVRRALGSDPNIASGGGSTVIMGLVGLCAVVGWRSRSRDGDWMRNVMLLAIALTVALGLILIGVQRGFPRSGIPALDNWGHACGTLMGVFLGFADPELLRQAGRFGGKVTGVLSVLILAASASAQMADDRAEGARKRETVLRALALAARDEGMIHRLDEIRDVYRAVITPRVIQRGSFVPASRSNGRSGAAKSGSTGGPSASSGPDDEQKFYEAVLNASLNSLESMRAEFETNESSADYIRVREIIRSTILEQPTIDEVREFERHLKSIRDRLTREIAQSRTQIAADR